MYVNTRFFPREANSIKMFQIIVEQNSYHNNKMKGNKAVIGIRVFCVLFTLCVINNALGCSNSVPSSTWLAVAVDMDHFLKYASLESTATSELSCAALAMRNSADLYCFQPQQCYLPAGGDTDLRAGETTGGWTCRSTKKREYLACVSTINLKISIHIYTWYIHTPRVTALRT